MAAREETGSDCGLKRHSAPWGVVGGFRGSTRPEACGLPRPLGSLGSLLFLRSLYRNEKPSRA
eukprot:11887519-Alexandrium_andersonii.AAC.1